MQKIWGVGGGKHWLVWHQLTRMIPEKGPVVVWWCHTMYNTYLWGSYKQC